MVRLQARHGKLLLQHIVPAVLKPAQALWNEVIGFLFLCLAVICGFSTGRSVMNYLHAAPGAGGGDFMRIVMGGFCTLLMLWYGVSSFLRARRVSRS